MQNGKKIVFPKANVTGLETVDSISDNNCKAQMNKYGDSDRFTTLGGNKAMGKALRRGMVLAIALWDDYGTKMKWLDGVYPPGADPNYPGVTKGPCPANSGDPNYNRNAFPNAYVSVTNLKVGRIGTTACRGKTCR